MSFFSNLWDYALLGFGLVLLFAGVYAWIAVRLFGHYIGLACGLIAVAIFGHAKGTYDERGKCNAAAIQSKLDAAEADLATIKSRHKAAADQARDLATSAKEKAGQVNELRSDLDDLEAVAARAIAERDAALSRVQPPLTEVVSPPPTLPPNKCASPPRAGAAPYRATADDIRRLRVR